MGRGLAESGPAAREVFDAADAALGRPLSRLCFDGSAEELSLTENTQPTILTVSIAALRALNAEGLRPEATAGHSLGEYSAHVAAGTVPFEDAVRAVELRGRYMQEAVPVGEGAMAAILGLDPVEVERICETTSRGRVVQAANYNGPGQTVIAGHRDAVERAVAAATDAGARRAVPLPVSAPFHCALMEPAASRLDPVLASITFEDPEFPVYTNVDAEPVRAAENARRALVRQVASPVRWQQLIERMVADGFDTFVEVGPGKVLSGLIRRIDRGARVLNVCDPEQARVAATELGGSA
jgi:[acyl-carrier-protein] S-malonyltransferase